MDRLAKIAFLTVFVSFCFLLRANGQTGSLRSLKERQKRLEKNENYSRDTAYLNVVNQIAFLYADSYPDSALKILQINTLNCDLIAYREGESDGYKITGNAYMTKGDYTNALSWYRKSYEVADKIGYKTAFPGIRNNIGLVYMSQGNYTAALKEFYEALKSAEAIHDKFVMASTLNNIAIIHFYQGKMDEADSTYKQTLLIAREMSDTIGVILAYNNIAEVNVEQNALPAALTNLSLAYSLASRIDNPEMLTVVSHSLGNTYFRMDSLGKAAAYFEAASKVSRQHGYSTSACKAVIGLARVRERQGLLEEALRNGLEGFQQARTMGHTQLLRDASEIVSVIYEKLGDGKNSLAYFKEFKIYSDSLRNLESERVAATYDAKLEFSKKEDELNQQNLKQQWMIYSALAALALLVVILVIVNRNRQRLNHTYKELQQKNIVIESQRKKAEETLDELKSAQAQLIQSEKMASLGELTAGIAHEIQNPLNFVNNFSETSIELLDEMKAEIEKGNPEEASQIASEVIENLERINQHGKRADSIVKGMLQHSRSSTGLKEPTDINALVDEYSRLSYHGLRARDKSFNATIKKDFDPDLGKVMMIPQDMGRVVLNLVNNAFYAVQQKQKHTAEPGYHPTVEMSTRKVSDKIIITVADNGDGVPEHIRKKIFQPFFTTKPTGQGTGLGLSLSYDIVTKGYGGTMDVQPKEGGGAVFTITLPG
ncbi:tetratricopeptide repeat-containing sensor histidine kinase [Dyadobacter pollutisoli]|uniref:histidine kinase n=1 Tax=Dyadobacter pollutisoli TaxID=2910158 RepID=A0A9E8NDX9_9BACT|nr:tetratricopeptide repeat protein [Dyadobacter pollutisoli]WAC12537.1 tetratricopeptide repeat protein [Dyadobacter pollutisoli]